MDPVTIAFVAYEAVPFHRSTTSLEQRIDSIISNSRSCPRAMGTISRYKNTIARTSRKHPWAQAVRMPDSRWGWVFPTATPPKIRQAFLIIIHARVIVDDEEE